MPTDQGSPGDRQVYSTLGLGSFTKGTWHCECNRAARCLTTKKSGLSHGKRFWRCAGTEHERCLFFLWVEHEAAAKDSWGGLQIEQAPQTPSRKALETPTKEAGNGSIRPEIETPFTKAKRKRAPIDVQSESGQAKPTIARPPQVIVAQEAPTRKTAKLTIFSTPAQSFTLSKNRISPVASPYSREQKLFTNNANLAPSLMESPGTLLNPARREHMTSLEAEVESSLTSSVLEVLRSDGVELKASTEIQLRHEIDLAVDIGKAKIQRYEETITKLRKRVDELENMVLSLTG